MSTAQLSPGTVVDGRFTIGAATWERVGAQSYTATDERGQAVVLTAYVPACFSSGLVLERSLRELRQLQSVQSPRAVAVLACGKLPDGGVYEVNGPLPDMRLDGLVAARGALPGPEAAGIIEQIGEGLLEAQKAGVIHRNLGPRAVFVGPQGAVVTGFSVGEPHSDKSFGPLDTIAPEQVEGKVVDQRTLIYNLAALMHMLITGAPLFPGDAATQLRDHLAREAPDEVHARLKRALGKDPRMRPMMLKQFLAELRAIGGGVARAPIAPSAGGPAAPPMPGSDLAAGGGPAKPAGAPTSRGWTMFMQGDVPAPTAAPVAAPAAAAPVAAPAAAAPAAEAPAKPKTRGWTMFMEATDEPAPAPASPAPASKPSTRGWTMLIEDEPGGTAGQDPAAQPAATPTPAAPAGAQPKTRGWTMFMEDDQASAAPDGTIVGPPPTPQAPSPAPTPAVAPTVGGGPAVKPSTRGWTMFMKADEESAAEAVAMAEPAAQPDEPETQIFNAPAAPAVAPPVAAAPAAAATTPKSSGWTMFTEAESDPAAAQAPASAEIAAAPASEPSATAGDAPRRNDTDAPSSKKRGWTMFMEKPLTDATQDPLGGVVPASGESNVKGWTVFSPAADASAAQAAADAAAAEPAADPGPSERSGPRSIAASGDLGSPASGHGDDALAAAAARAAFADDEAARAQAAADADRLRAKTLVVTGQPDPSLGARSQTVITPPGSSPAAGQRMVTVVQSEPPVSPMGPGAAELGGPGSVGTAASGAVSGPISTGLTGPISTGISGPISTGMSGPVSTNMPVHTGPTAMEPAKKGSPVVLIVVGIALVAAVIVGAILMLD